MKNKFRIGIFGAGGVVRDWHLPVLGSVSEWNIVWVCDICEKAAQSAGDTFAPNAKAYRNIDQCTDVDAVLVAVPVGYRDDLLFKMFDRKWNVFCEKPFAINLKMHESLLRAAETANVQIGVGFMRRYYRPTLTARSVLRSGVLGELKSVIASQGTKMIRTGRSGGWYQANRKASGGGCLMETGTHLVDQVFTILEIEDFTLTEVYQDFYQELDVDTKINARIRGATTGDVNFSLRLSTTRDIFHGISLHFERSILKVGVLPTTLTTVSSLDGKNLIEVNFNEGAILAPQAFYLEWSDFIRQCQSDGLYRSRGSAEKSLLTTKFIDECYLASQEKGLISSIELGVNQ